MTSTKTSVAKGGAQTSAPYRNMRRRLDATARDNASQAGDALRSEAASSESLSHFEEEHRDELTAAILGLDAEDTADSDCVSEIFGTVGSQDSQSLHSSDALDRLRDHERQARKNRKAHSSIDKRFKQWLGVKRGEHRASLAAAERAADPSLTKAAVSQRVEAAVSKSAKARRFVYEQDVSDDKMCAILLREYTERGDVEAGDIYRQLSSERAHARHPTNEHRRRLALADIENVLDAAVRAHANKRSAQPKAAVVNIGQLTEDMQLDVHEGTFDGLLREPITHQLDPAAIEASVQSFEMLVGAHYNVDQALTGSEVDQNHVKQMRDRLLRSIDQTIRMVRVAPSDAIFCDRRRFAGHPIADMHRILHAATDGEIDIGVAAIARYLNVWHSVHAESTVDFDRALLRNFDDAQMRMIVEAFKRCAASEVGCTAQLDETRIGLDLAFGRRPRDSLMMACVAEHFQAPLFAEAHEAALDHARTDERCEKDVEDERLAAKRKLDTFRNIYARSAQALETCSRSYLRDYLRASAGLKFGERDCARNASCISRVMNQIYMTGAATSARASNAAANAARRKRTATATRAARHFTLREFLLPSEYATFVRTGKLPREIKMCLLCDRYMTTAVVMLMQQQTPSENRVARRTLAQTHSVVVDSADGYNADKLLPVSTGCDTYNGIVKPSIAFSEADYAPTTVEAHGLSLPAYVESPSLDFRLASSSETVT